MQPPSPLDATVQQVIREELAEYGDAATIRHEWSDRAGMWFVEVDPVNSEAARLSVGLDGDGQLSITFGRTSYEMCPSGEAALDDFRLVVRAVFAGRIEEAGGNTEGAGTSRIYTDRGPQTVGAAFPAPWRLRRHRRYQPYT